MAYEHCDQNQYSQPLPLVKKEPIIDPKAALRDGGESYVNKNDIAALVNGTMNDVPKWNETVGLINKYWAARRAYQELLSQRQSLDG